MLRLAAPNNCKNGMDNKKTVELLRCYIYNYRINKLFLNSLSRYYPQKSIIQTSFSLAFGSDNRNIIILIELSY